MKPLMVALLGCGNVGEHVAEIVYTRGRRYGFELSGIVVEHPDKERNIYDKFPALRDRVAGPERADAIITDSDIVVELVGYKPEALGYMRTALDRGKDLVSGNKEHLAAETNPRMDPDLFSRARNHEADVAYEAAVAGGIPIVRALRDGYAPDRVQIVAIINGTTNYILTRMAKGVSQEEALSEAQQLGYAEADPSTDVDAIDPACKLSLIASLNHQSYIDPRDVPRTGIRGVGRDDVLEAQKRGYAVKLVAYDLVGPIRWRGKVAVTPALVPLTHELATANGRDNMIVVDAGQYGRYSAKGPGAGGGPTARSVFDDLKFVAANRLAGRAAQVPFYLASQLRELETPPQEAYGIDRNIIVPGAIERGWVDRALQEVKDQQWSKAHGHSWS